MLNLLSLKVFTSTKECSDKEWLTATTNIEGISYVLVSVFSATEYQDPNMLEINKEIARSRWHKFRYYWKLARLFREMRQEEKREPLCVELFAFLQFPTTYNWRSPTANERYCMLRWAEGLDDVRHRKDIYARSKWIADQCIIS